MAIDSRKTFVSLLDKAEGNKLLRDTFDEWVAGEIRHLVEEVFFSGKYDAVICVNKKGFVLFRVLRHIYRNAFGAAEKAGYLPLIRSCYFLDCDAAKDELRKLAKPGLLKLRVAIFDDVVRIGRGLDKIADKLISIGNLEIQQYCIYASCDPDVHEKLREKTGSMLEYGTEGLDWNVFAHGVISLFADCATPYVTDYPFTKTADDTGKLKELLDGACGKAGEEKPFDKIDAEVPGKRGVEVFNHVYTGKQLAEMLELKDVNWENAYAAIAIYRYRKVDKAVIVPRVAFEFADVRLLETFLGAVLTAIFGEENVEQYMESDKRMQYRILRYLLTCVVYEKSLLLSEIRNYVKLDTSLFEYHFGHPVEKNLKLGVAAIDICCDGLSAFCDVPEGFKDKTAEDYSNLNWRDFFCQATTDNEDVLYKIDKKAANIPPLPRFSSYSIRSYAEKDGKPGFMIPLIINGEAVQVIKYYPEDENKLVEAKNATHLVEYYRPGELALIRRRLHFNPIFILLDEAFLSSSTGWTEDDRGIAYKKIGDKFAEIFGKNGEWKEYADNWKRFYTGKHTAVIDRERVFVASYTDYKIPARERKWLGENYDALTQDLLKGNPLNTS